MRSVINKTSLSVDGNNEAAAGDPGWLIPDAIGGIVHVVAAALGQSLLVAQSAQRPDLTIRNGGVA